MTWRWKNNDNVDFFFVGYQTTFEGKMQGFSDGRTTSPLPRDSNLLLRGIWSHTWWERCMANAALEFSVNRAGAEAERQVILDISLTFHIKARGWLWTLRYGLTVTTLDVSMQKPERRKAFLDVNCGLLELRRLMTIWSVRSRALYTVDHFYFVSDANVCCFREECTM